LAPFSESRASLWAIAFVHSSALQARPARVSRGDYDDWNISPSRPVFNESSAFGKKRFRHLFSLRLNLTIFMVEPCQSPNRNGAICVCASGQFSSNQKPV